MSILIDIIPCKVKLTVCLNANQTMNHQLTSTAVIFDSPGHLSLRNVPINRPGDKDLLVEIDCTGISTGTEKLLWQGNMPAFPGLAYPLVPGYEAVGRVIHAGDQCDSTVGDRVFVPGSACYQGDVRGLFGATASQLVVPESRVTKVGHLPSTQCVLFALAATATHILTHRLRHQRAESGRAESANESILLSDLAGTAPELIVGHGTLGRLLARICIAVGADAPVVWEADSKRRSGAIDYQVIAQSDDDRFDYNRVCDVSGAGESLFDTLIARLARGGSLVLGGFYSEQVRFNFPAAFMREAQISIAAEWLPEDLALTQSLVNAGALSLQGLVTHDLSYDQADHAYSLAFNDPDVLKMVLNWSSQ